MILRQIKVFLFTLCVNKYFLRVTPDSAPGPLSFCPLGLQSLVLRHHHMFDSAPGRLEAGDSVQLTARSYEQTEHNGLCSTLRSWTQSITSLSECSHSFFLLTQFNTTLMFSWRKDMTHRRLESCSIPHRGQSPGPGPGFCQQTDIICRSLKTERHLQRGVVTTAEDISWKQEIWRCWEGVQDLIKMWNLSNIARI